MPGTTPQADQLRADLAALVEQAVRDLATVPDSPAALEAAITELINVYGSAAGTLAADWYDDLRDMQEISGSFRAIVPEVRDPGTAALVAWAAQHPSMMALIQGGMQRRILNVARGTITGSSVADPKARGWQRVGHGECAWCRMLISRGAVYTKATVDFASHDSCQCTGMPAWGGREIPVKPYKPSPRGISDADQARAKAWIAANL